MSKVVKLSIKNFRKFKHFETVFGMRDTICLIGRGDSGKSTILDAISYCLSPSWNIPIFDYDFCDCNVSESIEICATVVDFPEGLMNSTKYGLYCSGWNPAQQKVVDATDDECMPALQIMLTIGASLEPKWEVVNHTSNERTQISAQDRAQLKVFMVSDYVNNHFAWANGSPLNSLSRVAGESLNVEALLAIMRQIRASCKDIQFGDFSTLFPMIERQASELGLATGRVSPAFDMKRLAVKEGTVCLHDANDLPLRLMGKGSKRLMSVAIQAAVSEGKGVILIDEIEQGLEPDRIRHLVHSLGKSISCQVFFTTHSNEALVEMDAENVFWLKNTAGAISLSKEVQGLVRNNPSAFFAKRVVLCEGKTECGFIQTLGRFFCERGGHPPLAEIGVAVVDGGGSHFAEYAKELQQLGVPFLLFCDSDEEAANARKEAIGRMGICVVDWEDQDAFEQGIYKELPDAGIRDLNELALKLKCRMDGMSEAEARQSMLDTVRKYEKTITPEMLFAPNASFTASTRQSLGKASKGKKDGGGAWFKSTTGGMLVGEIICRYYADLPSTGYVRGNLDAIEKWLYGV